MALSNPSLENDRIVDEYISDPVLQLVRETEAKRQRPSADGLQGQLTDRNSLSLLGEPIFQLLPYEGNLDDGHIRNRIHTIQTTLGDITKRVTYREAEGTPVAAGYKFLRWGLLGLNKGPQISHLMEYLGRSETLSRVRLASTVTDSRLD
ncbi:hypothetical protein HMPREF1624_04808 [Sporothrix schenckii ATCC 58251]|uniref:Aminoacyl-tRNA synthetase class I anticodon-binding domain-containing protein n=1 Tax=Sporothrix schenckii (strain ATCC 58251 / de Perez 2211183) TaxID=1391915 RepID=U7PU84_SPOS1|nr:hypothetical protein HMPREF1624_04808 [Sporothrix schenckii ATCC 58251]